jgi:L-cysteine S-thiosulfotransferase
VPRTHIAHVVALAVMVGTCNGSAARAADEARSASMLIAGDAIAASLTGSLGDPARGREIAFGRERGNCVVCHAFGTAGDEVYGDVGPSLTGIADRRSPGQIRLRLVDSRRINPASLMPSYYRVDGLTRVAASYVGKPVLTAGEIEDVIAFLTTLHDEGKK